MQSVQRSVFLAVFVPMLAGTVWGAEAFYVDNSRPDDTGDGLGWATAKKTIQAAVDLTADGDSVTVSNGTYNITTQISITKAITVRSYTDGAYGGLANASNTVVRGPGGGSGIRIFNISHADAALDGFTAANGRSSGAGVYMTGGLVRDCIIRNCSAGNGLAGDGVYMTGGMISNSIVRNNYHGGHGGGGVGIHAEGSARILYCRILDNTSGDVGGYSGGGVHANLPRLVSEQSGKSRNGRPCIRPVVWYSRGGVHPNTPILVFE